MHIELFLSAVSERSYRDSLRALLKRPNVDIHVQEDFIPTGTETGDKLDGVIARCHAVIHLAGDMTGSWAGTATLQALRARYSDLSDQLPPLKASLKCGEPPLSYTQWEAYLAVYHQMKLVIAVPEPGTPRDTNYRVEAEQQASQHAHLERLRALGHHAEIRFRNADELATQVLRSSILDLLAQAGVVTQIMLVFKDILRTANSLLERSGLLSRAERERRVAMAELFEKISGCLTSVSSEIRAGRVPHGKCSEVLQYALALPDMKELSDAQAEELGRTLRSAYDAKGAAIGLKDISNAAEMEPYLKDIDEASGKFQALANLVRFG
jgi:hypothetical protein